MFAPTRRRNARLAARCRDDRLVTFPFARDLAHQMPQRQHFFCEFLLGGQRTIVIWCNGSPDGLLVKEDGRLASFASQTQGRAYAESLAIAIEAQAPTAYDLDALERWSRQPLEEQIDCERFLDAWNMLNDVAASVDNGSSFIAADAIMNAIYEKMFRGANLLRPPGGEIYEPAWTEDEIQAVAKLFGLGIQVLRGALSA